MTLRDRLFEIYWKIEKVLVPGLRYSHSVYEGALAEHLLSGVRWLDLGCGHRVLSPWRLDAERRLVDRNELIVGLDYNMDSLRKHQTVRNLVRGDLTRLPFAEGSFDLVTANMVLEHLDQPITPLGEIHRVLAPNGVFLFHTPNLYGYTTMISRLIPDKLKPKLIGLVENREEADVFKTHYQSNSQARLIELADHAGFRSERIEMLVSSATCAVLTPIVVFELLWIRLLKLQLLRQLRTNIIGVFVKPDIETRPAVRSAGR